MKCYMKSNLNKAAALLIGIIFLASLGSALTYIGQDEEGFGIISGSTFATRISPTKNMFYIDNMISIQIFPTIKVGNAIMQVPGLKYSTPVVGAKLSTYEIKSQDGVAGNIYANVDLKMEDNKITQTIRIENTNDKDTVVTIDLSNDTNSMVEYVPFVKERSRTYLIMSPLKRGIFGRLLAIYFKPYPPSFVPANIMSTVSPKSQLFWSIRMPKKSKYTLEIVYIPAYLAQTSILNQMPVKSPIDKEPFMLVETDPFITFYHEQDFSKIMPSLDLTKPGSDILSQIETYVNKLPSSTPDFGLVSYVDWSVLANSQGYNSFEKSIIFREICRQVGIPARLHIGKKREGNYYAWVTAYVGNIKITYDPFGKRGDYPQIYEEPMPYLCRDQITNCRFEGMIKTGVVCIGSMCVNVILIAGILVLIIIIGLSLVMYKSDIIMKIVSGKQIIPTNVDGNYEILSDNLQMEDPLIREVFNYIKDNNGLVDVAEMSHVLGYSKVLVTSAVEKLVELRVIGKV